MRGLGNRPNHKIARLHGMRKRPIGRALRVHGCRERPVERALRVHGPRERPFVRALRVHAPKEVPSAGPLKLHHLWIGRCASSPKMHGVEKRPFSLPCMLRGTAHVPSITWRIFSAVAGRGSGGRAPSTDPPRGTSGTRAQQGPFHMALPGPRARRASRGRGVSWTGAPATDLRWVLPRTRAPPAALCAQILRTRVLKI